MATEINTTVERFEVDAANAVAGAKTLAAAERDLGVAFETKDKAAGGTLKTVAAYKEGLGRARETAMFFTNSLQAFGPAGQMAQTALSGVAGAIMGGGGVLLALSAAQVAARLFAESQEEARKAAEASRKEMIALADEAARLGETTQRSAVAAAQVAFMEREIVKLREKAAALRAEGEKKEANEIQKEIDRLDRKRTELSLHIPSLRAAEAEAAARARREEEKADKAEAERRAAESKARAARRAAEGKAEGAALSAQGAGTFGGANVAEEAFRKRQQIIAEMQASAEDATSAVLDLQTSVAIGGVSLPEEPEDPFLKRLRLYREETAHAKEVWDNFTGTLAESGREMASSAVAMFTPLVRGSRAFDEAMEDAGGTAAETADLSAAAFAAMTQQILASLAERAMVESLMQGAMALADLAVENYKGAAQHGAAAAAFAAVAALAGAGAYVIGQHRGMTAAERAQVEALEAQNGESDSGGYLGNAGKSETVTIRETPIVIAHPFMTQAEAAAYAARAVEDAYRLDLLKREA